MERYFIATSKSKYFHEVEKYNKDFEEQRRFVKKFFNEKGIEATEYRVGGNGCVNSIFNEWNKGDIKLYIVAEDRDLINFEKMLTKPDTYGLRSFRKNSKIAKEFAEECIDKRIIVLLHDPRLGEYFKSIGYRGYTHQEFKHNDKLYVMIENKSLEKDDTPEGFIEIKGSEYHLAIEELKSKIQ